ncbi:hypothetical protein QZH41_011725 [Actinostola sp. cb2023]|nr:hypothetical protein QZH41_011725 [Actinostola sp. cb2023]
MSDLLQCEKTLLKNTYTVKNSIEFTDKMKTKAIQPDDIMGITLRYNNYPDHFIRKCADTIATPSSSEDNNSSTQSHRDNEPNQMIVLPYVNGVSEKISRALRPHGIKIAHKPLCKISELFPRPKATKDATFKTGVVYKVKCSDCDFIYYGQTERSLRTRMAEHRRAICNNQKSSKIAQHANETAILDKRAVTCPMY